MKQLTKIIAGTTGILLIGTGVMACNPSPSTANAASSDTNNTVVSTGMVDLTKAAESSVNAVVYIKVTMNGKTQTVNVRDPFSDFFGDFFGFGNGGTQKRQIQTPKRQASGSGVIISQDGYIVTNNHVVGGADELLVKLNDNHEYKAIHFSR